MATQIVDGRQGKLVLGRLLQLLMVAHQCFFIVFLMREVEQQPNLQRSLVTLEGLSSSIVVLGQRVVTT